MIFDRIENLNNYSGLGRIYTALKFLADTDFTQIPLGKYELDGDNIYYMVCILYKKEEKIKAFALRKGFLIYFFLIN